jgi:hypothetical protein
MTYTDLLVLVMVAHWAVGTAAFVAGGETVPFLLVLERYETATAAVWPLLYLAARLDDGTWSLVATAVVAVGMAMPTASIWGMATHVWRTRR